MREDQAYLLVQNQKENISLIDDNRKLQDANKQLIFSIKTDENMFSESDDSDGIPVRNYSKTKCLTAILTFAFIRFFIDAF